jgi:ribosomal protein S16
VADKNMPRDGRFLELIGFLNNLKPEHEVKLNEERVKHWIEVGAKPSDTVASIIDRKMPGYLTNLETARLAKIRSKRSARKARLAAAN